MDNWITVKKNNPARTDSSPPWCIKSYLYVASCFLLHYYLRMKYNMLQIIFRICLWYAHNFNTKRKFEVLCTLNIL